MNEEKMYEENPLEIKSEEYRMKYIQTDDRDIPFEWRDLAWILEGNCVGSECGIVLPSSAKLEDKFYFINHALFLNKPSLYPISYKHPHEYRPTKSIEIRYLKQLIKYISEELDRPNIKKTEGKLSVRYGRETIKNIEMMLR